MKLRLTPKAEEDLVEVYGYGVRTFGVGQAERYYADLQSTLLLLADRPFIARQRFEFTPPVRVQFHKNHVIVFVAQDDFLLVVRILGSRQDWARILMEAPEN
jgi:toxin ParE1/3/4